MQCHIFLFSKKYSVLYVCVEKRDVVSFEINSVLNELVHIEIVYTVRRIPTQYLSSNHINISIVKSLGTDIREQAAKKRLDMPDLLFPPTSVLGEIF